MIANRWRRVLLIFALPTPRQNISKESPQPLEEVPDELCHPQSVDLSNTACAQRWLINKLPGIIIDVVTRIRPILIIIISTTNVVTHNGIPLVLVWVLVVMTTILLQWGYAKILLHLVPYPSIVLHLITVPSNSTPFVAGPKILLQVMPCSIFGNGAVPAIVF